MKGAPPSAALGNDGAREGPRESACLPNDGAREGPRESAEAAR